MIEPNFLFLFFLTMALLTVGVFIFYQYDILQPAVLMSGSMTFSAFMAYLAMDRWVLPFSVNSYFLLTLAISMFVFGSVFCSWCGFSHCKLKNYICEYRYEPKVWIVFIVIVILILLAALSFRELYNLSVLLGNTNGYANIIKTIRPYIENQSVSLSRWMNYRQAFSLALSSIFSYMFLFNIFYSRFKLRDLILLLPIILYIPFMIFTTGRMAMMSFVIFIFVLGTFLYQKSKSYTKKSAYNTLIFFVVAGILFVTFFLLMGFFTGKIASENHTISMILAHYAGVSLPAFDKAIHTVYTDNGFVGSHTLLGIYRILSRIGIDVPSVDIFLPFVKFNGIDTNVYTAEWRYYRDFGIFGMSAIMWILGATYTFFYNCLKYGNLSSFFFILYASVSFPLFLSSIDERFFLDLFGTAIFYNIGLLLIMKYCLLDYSKQNRSDDEIG